MELLSLLQQIPGPSGDEGAIADFLEERARSLPGTTVRRLGDTVVAVRGTPRVAVLAHVDTVGFTLGYDRVLIPIGGPKVDGDEELREVRGSGRGRIRVREKDSEKVWRLSGKDGAPGSRWIYAPSLKIRDGKVSGPYLDNRAGVWNGVRTLESCEDVAVLFTAGEEHSGKGACLAARVLHEELGVTRALISDITWHTRSIRNGRGPAVSLRDRSLPRQRFLEQVLAAAERSGLPFQREVESGGGSDGSILERTPYPIDWVFVGAPQKRSHTPREQCLVSDLEGMAALYAFLVRDLSQ